MPPRVEMIGAGCIFVNASNLGFKLLTPIHVASAYQQSVNETWLLEPSKLGMLFWLGRIQENVFPAEDRPTVSSAHV